MSKSKKVKTQYGNLVRFHYCTRVELTRSINGKRLQELLVGAGYIRSEENNNEYEKEQDHLDLIVESKDSNILEIAAFNLADESDNDTFVFETELYDQISSLLKLLIDKQELKSFDIHGAGVKSYGDREVLIKVDVGDGFRPSGLSSSEEVSIQKLNLNIEEVLSLDTRKTKKSKKFLLTLSYTARSAATASLEQYKGIVRSILIDDNRLVNLELRARNYIEVKK